jgi:hypothetical protein
MKSIDKEKFFKDIRAQSTSPELSDVMLQQLREKASQVCASLFRSVVLVEFIRDRFYLFVCLFIFLLLRFRCSMN